MSINLNIRQLQVNDYNKGFFCLLKQLTSCSELTVDTFLDIFDNLTDNIHIYVIEYNNKIIATGTLLIEQKFIHDGKKVGHIEDIVVDKEFRGKGLGKKIILYLIEKSRTYRCYKTILNCSHENIGFYEKLGFKVNEVEMRIDFS